MESSICSFQLPILTEQDADLPNATITEADKLLDEVCVYRKVKMNVWYSITRVTATICISQKWEIQNPTPPAIAKKHA